MQDLEYQYPSVLVAQIIGLHLRAFGLGVGQMEDCTLDLIDELHFGLGAQWKLGIIRRLGERYCFDCMQEAPGSKEKDNKGLHTSAMVGWNYIIRHYIGIRSTLMIKYSKRRSNSC